MANKQPQLASMASSRRRTTSPSQKAMKNSPSSAKGRSVPIQQKKKVVPSSSSLRLTPKQKQGCSEDYRNLSIPYMEQQIRWGWTRLRRNDGCHLLIQELFGSSSVSLNLYQDHTYPSTTEEVTSLLLQQGQGNQQHDDIRSSSDSLFTSTHDHPVTTFGYNELLLIVSLKIVKDKRLPLGERYAARQYYKRLLRQYTNRWTSVINSIECDDTILAANCRLPLVEGTAEAQPTISLFDKMTSHFDLANLYSDSAKKNDNKAYKHYQKCLKYAKSYYGTIYHSDVAHVYRGMGIINYRMHMQDYDSAVHQQQRTNRSYNEVYDTDDDASDDIDMSSRNQRRNEYIRLNINDLLEPFCMDIRIKIVLGVEYKTKYSYSKICYLLKDIMNLTKEEIKIYFQQLKHSVLLQEEQRQQRQVLTMDLSSRKHNRRLVDTVEKTETREEEEEESVDYGNVTASSRDGVSTSS